MNIFDRFDKIIMVDLLDPFDPFHHVLVIFTFLKKLTIFRSFFSSFWLPFLTPSQSGFDFFDHFDHFGICFTVFNLSGRCRRYMPPCASGMSIITDKHENGEVVGFFSGYFVYGFNIDVILRDLGD